MPRVASAPGGRFERQAGEAASPAGGKTPCVLCRSGEEIAQSAKIRTDAAAARAAQALNARAFTVGDTISFAAGQYQPHSPAGRDLIDHELAHVAQQQRHGPMLQRQPFDPTLSSISAAVAAGLGDDELARLIGLVMTQLGAIEPTDAEYGALYANVVVLAQEYQERQRRREATPGGQLGPGMLPLILKWHAAGMLDPPFRPPDVPALPPYPATEAEASTFGLSGAQRPGGGAPGAFDVTPMVAGAAPFVVPPVAPPVGPVPPVGAPPLGPGPTAPPRTPPVTWSRPPPVTIRPTPTPAPTGSPSVGRFTAIGRGLAFGAAALILFWPSTAHAPGLPRWRSESNPITGKPYGSPDEMEWVERLSPPQADFLRRLDLARRIQPDPTLEDDPVPWHAPEPTPQQKPDRRQRRHCAAMPIRRRGGHARHDAYATKVTGSTEDYLVKAPAGVKIAYDGQGRLLFDVWEVKVGYGWFHNVDWQWLRETKMRDFDVQRAVGLAVANACGYMHFWAIPDAGVAQMLNARWGGVPPVWAVKE